MNNESRRRFLKKAGVATAGLAAMPLLGQRAWAAGAPGVGIVLEATDPVAKLAPSRWAAEQLRDALTSRGVASQIFDAIEQVPAGYECVLATGKGSKASREILDDVKLEDPAGAESLALARGRTGKRTVSLACGSDARGLVYALLEMADVVKLGGEPVSALRGMGRTVEQPANRVRSVARLFTSDVEDKGWFNDKAFWRDYLTMLAAERFNRFALTLGIGYDFASDITDCYFHFAYPFLVSVPGYDVKAVPLPDEERAANLEMLKFISEETVKRGMHFQLGIWTHAYKWTRSPRANFTIQGLTDETQGPYSRDALRTVLEACPAINGVTFRIHGESGVPERSYGFWRMVFDGMVKTGRPLEIDMHAKGMDQPTIDAALETGLPVKISPKFWAEHQGLPYMQAAIRQLEMPPRNAPQSGLFTQSSGSRSFLRYGYGDLMVEGRKYGVLHRIWPGTQRVLLWGDPAMASAYGRNFSFCGSDGYELMEPLSFKGRKGSGLPGGREGYADETLKGSGGGWQKYLYSYRLWGRLSYNPDAAPETWQRLLKKQFGGNAGRVEAALASASRILPTITTAHCPSAANNTYWPENYLNMPTVDTTRQQPYGDSPSPKRFGTVSPLDPGLFCTVEEYAEELLKGERSGKYSPIEVEGWLNGFADEAAKNMKAAGGSGAKDVNFRRLEADVWIQAGVGRFFAGKFRAALLYAIYDRSGHRPSLEGALKSYKDARAAWADMVERTKGVYAKDITYGYVPEVRRNWEDRLTGFDTDIADMQKKLDAAATEPQGTRRYGADAGAKAMKAVTSPAPRPTGRVAHTPPKSFRRGETVPLSAVAGSAASLRLHYRHVNQAEVWRVEEMKRDGNSYSAVIAADYTGTDFPLEYYFELRDRNGAAWLHPGLGAKLVDQPYYVVRQG